VVEVDMARRRVVVLVDDDVAYLEASRRSMSGYAQQIDLVLMASAEHALDYVPGHRVDLLVLDAVMPGTGGLEACRRLRTSGIEVPLAVASGHMSADLELEAYGAGATYALEKPVDLLGLLGLKTALSLIDQLVEVEERRRLIADHLDLARNIAGRLARRYASLMSPEDVDGPAMVGLCEAAARFDRTRAEPFVAFAERRIRGAILDELRRLGTHGRVVYQRQRRSAAARRAIARADQDPTDERVAKHLGLSLETVQKDAQRNTRVHDDISGLPWPGDSPDVQVERAQILVYLAQAREVLPEQEAAVINLHYDAGMSLAKVACALRLTPTRVAELHETAVARLRDGLRDGEVGPRRRPARGTLAPPKLDRHLRSNVAAALEPAIMEPACIADDRPRAPAARSCRSALAGAAGPAAPARPEDERR
jgi:RNA polymerase sigma factor for flagellar operon FliA